MKSRESRQRLDTLEPRKNSLARAPHEFTNFRTIGILAEFRTIRGTPNHLRRYKIPIGGLHYLGVWVKLRQKPNCARPQAISAAFYPTIFSQQTSYHTDSPSAKLCQEQTAHNRIHSSNNSRRPTTILNVCRIHKFAPSLALRAAFRVRPRGSRIATYIFNS